MLYILINPEEYDCYTVDVAYPIELSSKEEFWAEYHAEFTKARQTVTNMWETPGFKVRGYFYESFDRNWTTRQEPKLLTMDEWVLEARKKGIKPGEVYRATEEPPANDLPEFIKIMGYKETELGLVWEFATSDEKGNWHLDPTYLKSETIRELYYPV